MSEITTYQPQAIMPVMDIQQAVARRTAIVQFTQSVMTENVHFGKVPGTSKNTLLKPGAEMLTTFFGLSPRFVAEEKTLDWTGQDHGGEPFFHFQYRCQLWRGDVLVGEGLGSCSSWEKKYRYRKAAIVCPECGASAISRSRYPPRDNPQGEKGWWCRECKTDYEHQDARITDQPRGQVLNPDPADIVNTIDKMAQKRALVAATLIAVNASEFFTQDMEDVIDGSFEPATATTTPAGGNGDNGHKPKKPEPAQKALPPEEWSKLTPPASFAELWSGDFWAALGYDNKNHAINTLTGPNGVYPGGKLGFGPEDVHIDAAWTALIDHQKSKLEPAGAS